MGPFGELFLLPLSLFSFLFLWFLKDPHLLIFRPAAKAEGQPCLLQHLATQKAPGSRLDRGSAPHPRYYTQPRALSEVKGDKMNALCQLTNLLFGFLLVCVSYK